MNKTALLYFLAGTILVAFNAIVELEPVVESVNLGLGLTLIVVGLVLEIVIKGAGK